MLNPQDKMQMYDRLCSDVDKRGTASCWQACREWANMRKIPSAGLIPPVTVDAWLEAGAPGARKP